LATAWARLGETRIKAVSTLLFLGLSPTLIGHAQEARNYSLALFFSTCLIAFYSKNSASRQDRNSDSLLAASQSAAAILLSLSHYFGLLFSVTATVIHAAFRKDRQSVKWACLTILIMSIWPLYHLAIASKAEDNLSKVKWIDVQPVIGTFQEFLAGVFPIVGIYGAILLTILATISLLNRRWRTAIAYNYSQISSNKYDSIDECRLLASTLFAFVILITFIDARQPLSTARNYIVTLPAVAFLFGDIIDILLSSSHRPTRYITAIVMTFILSSLLSKSIDENLRFTHPLTNYKAVASAVNEEEACDAGCYATNTNDKYKVYFDISRLRPISEAKGRNPELIVAIGTNKRESKELQKDYPKLSCWEPMQSIHTEVFVLIKDPEQLNLNKRGFTPCDKV